MAEACHEANRSYCQAIGDNSQPAWADAPAWMKESAINGVKHHLENPNETPQGSHEAWLKHKTETGWKYGPVKDPEKKEHPCFVPYDQLSEQDKAKDFIFRGLVRVLAKI